MRKSEYIAARQEFWAEKLRASEGPIAEQVNRDVIAVEAAFDDEFEWEPEESPLPEQLRLDETGMIVHDSSFVANVASDCDMTENCWYYTKEQRLRIAREMVHRYNLHSSTFLKGK